MDPKRCENCQHFVFWELNNQSYDHQPEGVCTAPRPLLGPAPNREVRVDDGKNCRMHSARSSLKGDSSDE